MTFLNHIAGKKSKISAIILLVLFLLCPYKVSSQQKPFALQNRADKRLDVNKEYNQNVLLKLFKDHTPVSGLAVSCDIKFHSDTSLVRIILIDNQYNEFLVIERFPLLGDSYSFPVTEYAEETSVLNNIVPYALRIEIIDASLQLKDVITAGKQKFISERKTDRYKEQNSEKVRKLNENLKKHDILWIAGETSVSKLTYQQKKQLFGGKLPNLQGFEYYSGGVFVMPGTRLTSELNNTKYADEFSWKQRHGQDWVTSVKNQGGCGSCWAFGAVGATELLVNLYFNRHLNLDLSEQDVVSCSLAGNCSGGGPSGALEYIRNAGVVNEECFPYSGWDVPCEEKCAQSLETVRIGNHRWSDYFSLSDSLAKKMIIEGPVVCLMSSWAHVLTLVGYKVIREGDNIFNFTIPPGHPYIGRTTWLFKNSWGEDWGDKGYLYSLSNLDNLHFDELFPPVLCMNYKDSDVLCVDEDGDGLYNWGIGPKPSQCPQCPDQPDGDDSDPCLGPMDKYGHIEYFTSLPVSYNISVLTGDTIPELMAEGENIRWYADRKKTALLDTGNSFATKMTDPGTYHYFATQTLSGCESDIQPVTLTIFLQVPPPIGDNVTFMPGDSAKLLYAEGDNINWYSDAGNPLYDERDGQHYETTLIGSQLWMAENLNYYTSEGSWYYNFDSLSYSKPYGRLYKYANYCPSGWHVPTDDEWIEMEIYVGMKKEDAHNVMNRGQGIGSRLKEPGTSHWMVAGGTNEFGFNAVPAGAFDYSSNTFFSLGEITGFYGIAEYFPGNMYLRILESYNDYITRELHNGTVAFSIRCVSNPSVPIANGNYYKPVYSDPGIYTYYVTQTVSGFESPSDTVVFTILAEVPPPRAEDISVCEVENVPDLTAEGQNIKWFEDAALKDSVYSGNRFSTGKIIPGSYTYYVTQSNGNYSSKADSVVLTILPIPSPPLSRNMFLCQDYKDSSLYATGENIKWYMNDSLVATGPILVNMPIEPGLYEYFVTQSNLGCESQSEPVRLLIYSLPEAPASNIIYTCENQIIPDLTAIGENIRWYADPFCIQLLETGSRFVSGKIKAGNYPYFVTQTANNCESKPGLIELVINTLPVFSLGKDTAINNDQSLILGPFSNDYLYNWFDGSTTPYFEVSGNDLGIGLHAISVIITDSNTCMISDTIAIHVIPITSSKAIKSGSRLYVIPDRTNKILHINFINFNSGDALLRLFNLNGDEIFNEKVKVETAETRRHINISSIPPGMYLLKVVSGNEQMVFKIILP